MYFTTWFCVMMVVCAALQFPTANYINSNVPGFGSYNNTASAAPEPPGMSGEFWDFDATPRLSSRSRRSRDPSMDENLDVTPMTMTGRSLRKVRASSCSKRLRRPADRHFVIGDHYVVVAVVIVLADHVARRVGPS